MENQPFNPPPRRKAASRRSQAAIQTNGLIDEATAYARSVIAGERSACKLHIAACKRHLADLKSGHKRGLRFDVAAAQYRIEFFPRFLRHSKGQWARQAVELSPWQKFVIGSVFGWKRADGSRRFRVVYEELPRKQGKSTKLAGVGIMQLTIDNEGGAEVYSAATKKDQARIIFDEAARMVSASPELRRDVRRFKFNLSIDATSSKFEPLSADEKTLDGLNPSCLLIDELHKHKNRGLLDVLDTAQGARWQPLLWIITTAGDDSPESVYAAENDYAVKVLEGTIEDDNLFAFITSIDKTDKWDDPAAWAKANPNLGISVKFDDLERQAQKAAKSPPALSAFKRLRLNVRTSSAERAIDMETWAKNGLARFDPAEMRGRRCWAGLDLSSKIDISAFVKLFEPVEAGGRMRVVARFWMPLDTLEERAEKDRVPFRQWVDQGHIEVTPGNVVDHGEIERAVLADNDEHAIGSVAYDPWNATQLAASLLGQGVPMVEFIQGLRSYSEPTKELLNLLVDNRLDHGGNPVLAWMASNLKTQRDKNENLMPHKLHSTGRIDGITALIMAIGRSMTMDQRSSPTITLLD
jgi:phage terminase large subunit-like protein